MAVRSTNVWPGGARLDSPLLRLIDAYTRGDFDLLAGRILAGNKPLIVSGFTLATFQTGGLPKLLNLVVRGGLAVHPGATASGSIFMVPPDREIEVLDPQTNPRVSGSYGASRANYIGLDIVRVVDVSSKEQLAFWEPTLEKERLQRVPLAKTQDYRIIITDIPFEQTTLLPLWIVTCNSAGAVTQLEDARPFLGSLATGGSDPDPHHTYNWPQGRTLVSVDRGGDKAIASFKDAFDAVMTRIREIGGGEFWYSPVCDRNVKMTRSGATFANGEYFEWTGTNLHWRGLAFMLPSSTGLINEIADQTVDSSVLTNLGDNECIYVDLDYSADHTGGSALAARKTPVQNLGVGDRDRSRTIIAWRRGSYIFTRDGVFPVNAEPFPELRNVLSTTPLYRRVRSHCSSSPTVVIEPIGTFYVQDGSGNWVTLTHSTNTSFTVSAPAINTRYYIYAYRDVFGALAFEKSTSAPTADLRWKTGPDYTRAFVTTVYTDGSSNVMPYYQTGEYFRYQYTLAVALSGGSAVGFMAVPLTGLVPAFGVSATIQASWSSTVASTWTVKTTTLGATVSKQETTNTSNLSDKEFEFALTDGLGFQYQVGNAGVTLTLNVMGFMI